ncbi:Rieske (2Fe-2S) protein [Streptomyces flavofungini]|uniref:Cytochrome bc1 complex Rieske iron-sulfur subunit n=1 Tax=Streptomyces flavofungini TaxID=68200 RepID=A0ABS0XHZ9_9ACTN|nr:Rieske (2Fe-2S) protein [Streptomyces flavofungini]MBJ3812847.1 Rieske (2Fe-2S) protein [Streptomyces flavofungini]GHC79669.1 iron-sulfur protein [Streptomyces flavofungini]
MSGGGRPTRRTALAAGALAAAAATGCSKYGDEGAEPEPPPSSPAASRSGGSPDATDEAPKGPVLAKTSDIPVGGGKVFKDEKVVVTQPAEGDFKAFSAVCTHSGCTVRDVDGGTVNCPCHGSRFRVADGAVAGGPAPRPLPPRGIDVTGNSIRLT